jgi:hypothetical protein
MGSGERGMRNGEWGGRAGRGDGVSAGRALLAEAAALLDVAARENPLPA